MTKLFVYGTLKKGFCNHHVLGSARFIQQDELLGFDMHHLGGFPAIVPASERDIELYGIDTVKGELYEINDKDLRMVDRLEGYREGCSDSFYERTTVLLESGEQALVYYHKRSDRPLIEDGIWS